MRLTTMLNVVATIALVSLVMARQVPVRYLGGSVSSKPKRLHSGFLRECGLEFAEWLQEYPDWLEGYCPLSLHAGIYAVNHQVAFLHGEISSAPGAYRSLLLRSADGGRSWDEAMQPVLGSSVIAVTFPTPEAGRALVGWAVEGPGELMVYATVDSGVRWRRLSDVLKPHSLDEPLSLSCLDETHCSITLECNEGPGHVMQSKDGGRTWRSRKQLVSGPPTFNKSVARDRTEWELLESEDRTSIRILRRAEGQRDWTTTAVVPRDYRRTPDGGLAACTR